MSQFYKATNYKLRSETDCLYLSKTKPRDQSINHDVVRTFKSELRYFWNLENIIFELNRYFCFRNAIITLTSTLWILPESKMTSKSSNLIIFKNHASDHIIYSRKANIFYKYSLPTSPCLTMSLFKTYLTNITILKDNEMLSKAQNK